MKKQKIGWAKTHLKSDNRAYTIIEVMIFLAVSAFMFVLAAYFINGKQNEVAYKQGMSAAGATLTNAINQIANGEYPPLPSGWKCEAPTTGTPSFTNANDIDQGQSSGCVFMGEVLQFGADGIGENYSTYVVAGRQFAPGTDADELTPAQSFTEADPVTARKANDWSLTSVDALEHGLAIQGVPNCGGTSCGAMYRCDDSGCTHPIQIGGIGLFGSFGSYNSGSANTQSSGAQSVAVVTMPTTNNMPDTIDSLLSKAKPNAPDNLPEVMSNDSYVVLCFGRGDKHGQVIVGGPGGQQTTVSIDYNWDHPC